MRGRRWATLVTKGHPQENHAIIGPPHKRYLWRFASGPMVAHRTPSPLCKM